MTGWGEFGEGFTPGACGVSLEAYLRSASIKGPIPLPGMWGAGAGRCHGEERVSPTATKPLP